MDTKIKHFALDLDKGSYRVNVLISLIPETIIINGTGRLEYLVSIPEWKWSINVAKANCSTFYWKDNLEGNIDKSLESYIQELSNFLSELNFIRLFEKG